MIYAFEKVLAAFVRACEKCRVPYVVGGSVASGAYGQPRQTNDIDIAVAVDLPRALCLAGELESEFMVDRLEIERTLATNEVYRSFQFLHLEEFIKVDVFAPALDDYTVGHFRRGKSIEFFDGCKARCSSPEDILLYKLRWYRLGGYVSDKQWNDIVHLIEVQGENLDREYLSQWANHFDVVELLVKARSETVELAE